MTSADQIYMSNKKVNKITYRIVLDDFTNLFRNEIFYVFDFLDLHYPIKRLESESNFIIGYGKISDCDFCIPSHGISSLKFGADGSIYIEDTEVLLSELRKLHWSGGVEKPSFIDGWSLENFDIVFVLFCLLSRIEEHNASLEKRDLHGRFSIYADCLYRAGLYGLPLVDYLSDLLVSRVFGSSMKTISEFKILPTHDVDRLASSGSIFNTFRNIAGDIIKRKSLFLAIDRFKKELDPFEPWRSFSSLLRFYKKNSIRGIFLFMSESSNSLDASYPTKNKKIYSVILNKLSNYGQIIGLHPGVESFDSESVYFKQKKNLERMSGVQVNFSRQHILKYDTSCTPRIISSVGIAYDFTLAYPEAPGFRNGTSRGYNAYDLNNRKKLKTITFSTSLMDFTLFEGKYVEYSKHQARYHIFQMYSLCKDYCGVLVYLLHTGYMTNRYKKFFHVLFRAGFAPDSNKFSFFFDHPKD